MIDMGGSLSQRRLGKTARQLPVGFTSMREGALFGTMFGLGSGAVLVGVTVSRLVVGQASEKPVEEPPAAVVETAPPAAIEPPPPAVISSVAPRAEIALSGKHRVLPRKHRRPSPADEAAPTKAPVVEQSTPTTASIPNREASDPAPPHQVADAPIAPDGPIAIVRGGLARPDSGAPGARVIQVKPQDH